MGTASCLRGGLGEEGGVQEAPADVEGDAGGGDWVMEKLSVDEMLQKWVGEMGRAHHTSDGCCSTRSLPPFSCFPPHLQTNLTPPPPPSLSQPITKSILIVLGFRSKRTLNLNYT